MIGELLQNLLLVNPTESSYSEERSRPRVSKTAILTEIRDQHPTDVTLYALRRYLDNGTKACALAGAGELRRYSEEEAYNPRFYVHDCSSLLL